MKRMMGVLVFVVISGGLFTFQACRKSQEHGAQASAALFHCPMHPTYTSDKPGDCPICGMKLVPVELKKAEEKIQTEQAVEGQAPVSLSENLVQRMGVRVEPVEIRTLESVIRASARVAYDPELFSLISEYREARIAREKVQESPWPDVRERAQALVHASELRLRQLGFSQEQIQRFSSASSQSKRLLVGQPGGSVWVYAQVYEYELPRVRVGQNVHVTSSAYPDRSFKGVVRSVASVLDPETRSARVVVDVPDSEGLLKPEMYVDAEIYIPLGRELAIPNEAILDTGTRQLVFVETQPGHFEPRQVRMGSLAQGYRSIRSGLKEGEKVVISGNFLIDSESKLKATLSSSSGHVH